MTLDERLTAWLDEHYEEVFRAKVIRRYATEDEQRRCGDVQVVTKHGERNVEEKAHGIDDPRWFDDCLLELIQAAELNWETRKMRGWFYDLHDCDFLLNGYFYPPDAQTPSVVRLLRWKKTRQAALGAIKDGKRIRTRWIPKGYGLTLCMYVPYSLLEQCVAAEWAVDERYRIAAKVPA